MVKTRSIERNRISRCFSLVSTAILATHLASAAVFAQEPQNIVQSGHSLTDSIISPLSDFVRAAGPLGAQVTKSTIPGSPLDWRWNHTADPDIRQPGEMRQFDVLVITERVPLAETMEFHRTLEFAERWCAHAWDHGANGDGARCILYASWVSPYGDGLSFEDRMTTEQEGWNDILAHLNAVLAPEAPSVPLIPGPDIILEAKRQIEAGLAPGIEAFGDLFLDDIHLNTMGNYLIALAHFAVIFDRDPRGLPHGVPRKGGPNKAQAAWMQDLVWTVLNR